MQRETEKKGEIKSSNTVVYSQDQRERENERLGMQIETLASI